MELLDVGRDALEPVAAEAEAAQPAELQQRGRHLGEAVPAEVEDAEGAGERRLPQPLGQRAGPAKPVVLSQQRVEARQGQQLRAHLRQPRPAHVQHLQRRKPLRQSGGQRARQPPRRQHQPPCLRATPRRQLRRQRRLGLELRLGFRLHRQLRSGTRLQLRTVPACRRHPASTDRRPRASPRGASAPRPAPACPGTCIALPPSLVTFDPGRTAGRRYSGHREASAPMQVAGRLRVGGRGRGSLRQPRNEHGRAARRRGERWPRGGGCPGPRLPQCRCSSPGTAIIRTRRAWPARLMRKRRLPATRSLPDATSLPHQFRDAGAAKCEIKPSSFLCPFWSSSEPEGEMLPDPVCPVASPLWQLVGEPGLHLWSVGVLSKGGSALVPEKQGGWN